MLVAKWSGKPSLYSTGIARSGALAPDFCAALGVAVAVGVADAVAVAVGVAIAVSVGVGVGFFLLFDEELPPHAARPIIMMHVDKSKARFTEGFLLNQPAAEA